jgi:hypothetical protein
VEALFEGPLGGIPLGKQRKAFAQEDPTPANALHRLPPSEALERIGRNNAKASLDRMNRIDKMFSFHI